MPAYNRSFLTADEKEKYGRRLSHYLEDYCHKNKITHNQAAEKLGIASTKFSQLKSGSEQGRFLTSLDYIKSLAGLDGMTIPEFLIYLDGKSNQDPKMRYSWQDKIYKALEPISISHRKKFADACTMATKDSTERVELMCRLATAVAGKNLKALEALVEAMEKI
jgi:hypothetical protein